MRTPRFSGKQVLAFALLGGSLCTLAQPAVPCATSVPSAGGVGVGASWDLSSLFSSTDTYNWIDNVDALTLNATYVFNVCGNTPTVPLACIVQQRAVAPAYQISTSGSDPTCYQLGSDLAKGGAMMWGLIDNANPALGVSITYQGGDNDFCDFRRALTVNFRCSSNATFPATGGVVPSWIEEVNRCQYVANSWSSIGCPRECPVVNGKVCGGAGICGWDVGLTAARCFCDNAQLTADCSAAAPAPATAATSTPVAVLAGSVVGGLVVGAVGVAATLLVLQRRGGAAAKPVDGFYGQ